MSRRRTGRWIVALGLVAVVAGTAFVERERVADWASTTVDQVSAWSTSLRDTAATIPEAEGEARVVTGASSSAMVVVAHDDEPAAFALLAASPEGVPVVVVLPQHMLVDVPGFGEFRLSDALAFEDADLAALAVTNEFGVRIDRVVTVPAGGVASVMPGPVAVELTAPFFVRYPSGLERVAVEGTSTVIPEMVELLLVEEGEGEAFEFIQRQGAAWRAILEQVAADPSIADRLFPDSAEAADLLVTAANWDGGVVASIPVERAEGVAGSGLAPVARADSFVAERLGHLVLRPEGRPRLEVLNGNGRVGTTRVVSDILIRHGFELVRTDNAASFDHETTVVIAQGDDASEAAREAVRLLGLGRLFLEVRAPSGVVDVSIIVGNDIPAGEG